AVVHAFNTERELFSPEVRGRIVSALATTAELALLRRLMRALGPQHVDFRLRTLDAGFDQAVKGTPWLGMPVADLNQLDRVLVVGSFLRKDHPLMAQRLRQAAKRGAQISFVGPVADDPLFPVAGRMTVAPSALPNALAEVLVAVAQAAGQSVPEAFADVSPSEAAQQIAASLSSGERVAVLVGNM